jgi:hypothetical protein
VIEPCSQQAGQIGRPEPVTGYGVLDLVVGLKVLLSVAGAQSD